MSLTPIMFKSSNILLQLGSTPLHVAAEAVVTALERGNERVIEILVKAGANVNATDTVSYYSIIV